MRNTLWGMGLIRSSWPRTQTGVAAMDRGKVANATLKIKSGVVQLNNKDTINTIFINSYPAPVFCLYDTSIPSFCRNKVDLAVGRPFGGSSGSTDSWMFTGSKTYPSTSESVMIPIGRPLLPPFRFPPGNIGPSMDTDRRNKSQNYKPVFDDDPANRRRCTRRFLISYRGLPSRKIR